MKYRIKAYNINNFKFYNIAMLKLKAISEKQAIEKAKTMVERDDYIVVSCTEEY